jgi:hypothetical protein
VKEAPNEWTYYRDAGEVRVADLASGRSEPLVPGLQALDYDISADGRQVVMETADSAGKPRLWLVPFDRSSPTRQVPNVEGGSPRFGPWRGDLFSAHRRSTQRRGDLGVGVPRSPGWHVPEEGTRTADPRKWVRSLQMGSGLWPGLRLAATEPPLGKPSPWAEGLR